jgi:hypothetical protein
MVSTDGENWTSTEVKAVGTDGKNGADGKDGQDGKDGTAGKDGKDGEDGRGIASMEIIDGSLWVTYTDSPIPVEIGKVSSGTTGGVAAPENYTDGLDFYMMKYVDPDGDTPSETEYVYGVTVGTARYMDHIIIPVVYNGKRVTAIMSNAFLCEDGIISIESITVPEGVEEIRENAFCGLAGATVTIPSTIKVISEYAFSGVEKVIVNMSEAEFSENGWSVEYLGCDEIEFLK